MVSHPHPKINHEPPPVEVIHFARCDERFVRARCRVRVGEIIISNVAVVVPTLGRRPFVQLPSRKIDDEWVPLISVLSPTLQADIDRAVLDAWHSEAHE